MLFSFFLGYILFSLKEFKFRLLKFINVSLQDKYYVPRSVPLLADLVKRKKKKKKDLTLA